MNKHPENIINVLIDVKSNGYSEYTLNFASKALSFLAKHADLNDSEAVKRFISEYNANNSYKRNLAIAYNKYVKFHGLSWKMPFYVVAEKRPKMPTSEKIDMITSAACLNLACKLSISKETGLRPIEVANLKVRDIDLEQHLIYPSTAKNGSGRVLKISEKTLNMLKALILKHKLTNSDKLFKGSGSTYGKQFRAARDKLSEKLQDPTIRQIRLYGLRHFFATMLYHKTRDLLLTKQQMGHKKIETTLIYTQLVNNGEEEYYSATAKTVEEAAKLIEQGFDYICDVDAVKLFRKRQ
ncbi:MAG: site-specific integrase [Candidatus Bathyarchaeia archaeon]